MADGNDHDEGLHNKIYNYPGKWSSQCWKYFGFYKVKPGPPSKATLDMKTAICKLCKRSYTNNANTSNFLAHIKAIHPNALDDEKEKQVQPKLSFIAKPNQRKADRSTVNDNLSKMIVGKVLPCSLVENEHFKSFVRSLDPKYVPPSRRDFIRSLHTKKEEMETKIKVEIQQCKNVSITHDGWTSLNTESYNTTTLHFINNDWELKTAVLDTKKIEGSHTSERIAETLQTTKVKWGLPEILATSDSAANEKKAFQLLNWNRFGCYGHRINLIVKQSMDIPEVKLLTGKARKLVTFFHTSTSAADMLKLKQKALFPPPSQKASHKLIMDVATRWNSTKDMLQRVVELMPAIVALANDENISKTASITIKKNAYTFEEVALAEKIVEVLSSFQKATDILCAENSPTMHKVLPVVVKLTRAVEITELDPPEIKALKTKMNSELLKRTECEEVALAACVLNPYTKDFKFLPTKKEDAHALLHRLASHTQVFVKREKDVNQNDVVVNPPLPALSIEETTSPIHPSMPDETEIKMMEPPVKVYKSADTEEWLEDVVCTGESYVDTSTLVEKELYTYFMTAQVEPGMTVLQWWKTHEHMYPRLSQLAKKYLSCPASSVPSERVFSLAGHLVNKKRCRLSPDNVDMFVFLNKNLKDYW